MPTPIGNTANLLMSSRSITALELDARRVRKAQQALLKDIAAQEATGVPFTAAQIQVRLNVIDINTVQTAFNSAKADYLNTDVIPIPEGA